MTHEQLSADVSVYRNMVYRLAFGCTGNRFDADDIAQEVFIKLCKNKKPFNDEEHKKAFLLRVTVNLCKNLQKSAWMRKRSELDESLPADNCFRDSENILGEYILKLKPKYRAIIYLYYFEEYTVTETAAIAGISESAVTTRLNRARNQLKTHLIDDKEAICYESI